MSERIILFDIDYTLFDTTLFKKLIAKKLVNILGQSSEEKIYGAVENSYADVRSLGSFDPALFTKFFIEKYPSQLTEKQLEDLWWDTETMEDVLYPEVFSVLEELEKDSSLRLGIFSSGAKAFQLAKMHPVKRFFNPGDIHIFPDKSGSVKSIVELYQDDDVTIIDDFISILQQFKNLKENITTIWMKRGKFAKKATIPEGFEPDYIIEDLSEILPILT